MPFDKDDNYRFKMSHFVIYLVSKRFNFAIMKLSLDKKKNNRATDENRTHDILGTKYF